MSILIHSFKTLKDTDIAHLFQLFPNISNTNIPTNLLLNLLKIIEKKKN